MMPIFTAPAQVSPGDMGMTSGISGVSGFAFQGTNAHVTLRSQAAKQDHALEGLALPLQESRHPASIARWTLSALCSQS